MTRPALTFILEQTLGHVAHGKNLRRTLASIDSIDATIVEIHYEPPSRLERLSGAGSWSVRASQRARKAILSRLAGGRVDGLFVHTQVASLLSVDLMRKIPTVISLDATPINFDTLGAPYGHRRQAQPLERFKAWANQRAFAAAAGLVSWSRWGADALAADYGVAPEKVRVIHPGVDLRLFTPSGAPPNDPVRVLFVGGDFERKGGRELLAAVKTLGDRVELDIVTGRRPEGVGPGVTVHTGLQPQSPELLRLYRQADIFALPTYGDMLPQVIAEAFASGLPVVSTAVGGTPEIVRHGVNGLLVPPGDVDQLAAALATLVRDPDLRRRLGSAGLELARREHNADANNRELVELVRSLATGEGSGGPAEKRSAVSAPSR
jgi:glycosyltransferase involved in cell wall biosynthesis